MTVCTYARKQAPLWMGGQSTNRIKQSHHTHQVPEDLQPISKTRKTQMSCRGCTENTPTKSKLYSLMACMAASHNIRLAFPRQQTDLLEARVTRTFLVIESKVNGHNYWRRKVPICNLTLFLAWIKSLQSRETHIQTGSVELLEV